MLRVLLCRYDCFISISNSLFEYNDFNSWFNSTYLYNHQRLQLYFINKRADISLPWLLIYCLSGLGIPAALASVLTISEGGYIVEDGAHLDLNWVQLAISPFAWSVVFLAVITVLYISAGF